MSLAPKHKKHSTWQPVVKLNKIGYNVSTSNRFGKLKVDNASPQSNKEKAKRPAPITIINSQANIDELLQNGNITYYNKLLRIGVKIFTETIDDRKKIVDILSKNKTEFYTHPDRGEKTFKIVLSGLPLIDTKLICDSLKEKNNLHPINVAVINSNNPNKLYILQFNSKETTKNDILKVKVVHNHIINWRPYIQRKKGPTQCFKCGMFGHGASNCFREEACLICSGKHDSKQCPFSDATIDGNQVNFKCVNCIKNPNFQHSHKAIEEKLCRHEKISDK